jgi:hypothetical protein
MRAGQSGPDGGVHRPYKEGNKFVNPGRVGKLAQGRLTNWPGEG